MRISKLCFFFGYRPKASFIPKLMASARFPSLCVHRRSFSPVYLRSQISFVPSPFVYLKDNYSVRVASEDVFDNNYSFLNNIINFSLNHPEQNADAPFSSSLQFNRTSPNRTNNFLAEQYKERRRHRRRANDDGRAQVERWLEITEKLLAARDLVVCKRFTERALQADPLLPGADEVLAVAGVLLASQSMGPSGHPDLLATLQLPPGASATASASYATPQPRPTAQAVLPPHRAQIRKPQPCPMA